MTRIAVADLTPQQLNGLIAVTFGWVPPTDPYVHDWLSKRPEHERAALQAATPDLRIWLTKRAATAQHRASPTNYCAYTSFAEKWSVEHELVLSGSKTAGYTAQSYKSSTSVRGATEAEAVARFRVHYLYGPTVNTEEHPWLTT